MNKITSQTRNVKQFLGKIYRYISSFFIVAQFFEDLESKAFDLKRVSLKIIQLIKSLKNMNLL